jgi:hypothetical protein
LLTKAVLLFIFSSSFAFATDKVTFTIVDRIQFVVPGDWPVIASKSAPEKAFFAFQIPNNTDEGTLDSTNLSIVSLYLKDAEAKEVFEKKSLVLLRPIETAGTYQALPRVQMWQDWNNGLRDRLCR